MRFSQTRHLLRGEGEVPQDQPRARLLSLNPSIFQRSASAIQAPLKERIKAHKAMGRERIALGIKLEILNIAPAGGAQLIWPFSAQQLRVDSPTPRRDLREQLLTSLDGGPEALWALRAWEEAGATDDGDGGESGHRLKLSLEAGESQPP